VTIKMLLKKELGMDAQAIAEILRLFNDLPEPRRHNTRHKLIDILTLALLAVICGADGWVGVVVYARSKEAWLRTFLELPSGIPSHDTFGRVFARLNPDAFEKVFMQWVASLVELSGGKLVAIDGKSLRRSFENSWDKCGMAHMVSAFVQANSLVFAQIRTDGKGHELDAIEKLLTLLDLQGAVVTIDAIGCNAHIAGLIVEAKADYLLQVKENQPTLLAKVKTLFDEAILENLKGFRSDTHQSVDGDHGRIETRKITVLWDVKHLGELAKAWPGLKSVAMVQSTREVAGASGMKSSTENHYYISTLDRRRKAPGFLGYIRGHWSVENNLHWQLDVSFNEDQRRIRKGHGAENFSRLCRMALNLLKNEKTLKNGIAIKRQNCGWDNAYLLKVIGG
jgi:predicted transposase YbfD/YdcC